LKVKNNSQKLKYQKQTGCCKKWTKKCHFEI